MLNLQWYNTVPKHHLAEYLPWSCIVAPGVFMQKDCIFQSSFRVQPANLSSCSETQVNAVVASINNLMMRFKKGWSVFFESKRLETNLQFQNNFTNQTGKLMETLRENFYKKNPLYEMQYYITFCYQYQSSNKGIQRFFHVQNNSLEETLQNFLKSIREIQGMLEECFLTVEFLTEEKLLSYLHSCISNTEQPVLVPADGIDIDEYLADEVLNIDSDFTLGAQYCSVISVNDFPHFTHANILEDLQTTTIDFRWQQRFIFLDEEEVLAKIKKARRKHFAQRKSALKVIQENQTGETTLENTEAVTRAMNADEALQLVGEGTVHFGLFTSVVVVKDSIKKNLQKKTDVVKKIFQKHGFIVREESLNTIEAWLSSLPGHVYANTRKFLLHSINFSHLLPLSTRWNGQRQNTFMKSISGNSSAHIIGSTNNNVFYLNLNVGDVGHSLIVGPTGAGKSTLLAMLALQFLRYPNAQVTIFDKDFSALQISKNVNAEIYVPGETDSSFSFQPFRAVEDEQERNWALQFCEQLLHVNGYEASEDEIDDMKRSLELLADMNPAQRTVSTFSEFLQFTTTKKIFEKYCSRGIYGTVFDGSGNDNYNSRWLMIEMSILMNMGEKALIPALLYLFHRIEQTFTGHPSLLIIDEGWLFLKNNFFAERFRMWLKTLRKKHVFVILATQELADVVNSALIDTIMSACQVKFFLPDKSAVNNQIHGMYKKFGLNDTEIQVIATAAPKRDYYICSANKRSLFSLDLNDEMLKLLHSPVSIKSIKE